LLDFPGYAQEAMGGGPMDLAGLLVSNAVFLVVMLGLCRWASLRATPLPAFLLIAWGGGHLFWNFIMHFVATVVTGVFSPGLITGTLLCYPLTLMVTLAAVRQNRVSPGAALIAFAAGGVLMGLIVWARVYG
jgi:hypothetical protein